MFLKRLWVNQLWCESQSLKTKNSVMARKTIKKYRFEGRRDRNVIDDSWVSIDW